MLDVSVKAEACEVGPLPTTSTTATLAMGDALAVALIERKGFHQDDFTILHPAAGLGRRLMTVGELMHSGEAVPRVLETTPLKDIIYEISSKKLGLTTVVAPEGELRGIITDGDLRRLMERRDDLHLVVASEFMSPNPKVIEREALATRALKGMEDHTITAILIVDGDGRVDGVIHLHDILRAHHLRLRRDRVQVIRRQGRPRNCARPPGWAGDGPYDGAAIGRRGAPRRGARHQAGLPEGVG